MTAGAELVPYDAVVLAGGRSRRMGVPDKTRLPVGGVPLLDRVLAAIGSADRIVVVGARRPTCRPVSWTTEQPAGTGPMTALLAGVALVACDVTVVAAGDLPFLTAADVDVLRATLSREPDADGVVAVDGDGRRQWLCSAWRTESLRLLRAEPNAALRDVLGGLRVATLPVGSRSPWLDCDTAEDIRRAEEQLA